MSEELKPGIAEFSRSDFFSTPPPERRYEVNWNKIESVQDLSWIVFLGGATYARKTEISVPISLEPNLEGICDKLVGAGILTEIVQELGPGRRIIRHNPMFDSPISIFSSASTHTASILPEDPH